MFPVFNLRTPRAARPAPLCALLLALVLFPCAAQARQNPTPTATPRPPTPSEPAPPADDHELTDEELRDALIITSDLANILLTATDRNRRFVTTLRAEDIRVLEDDAPQEIIIFKRETDAPLSLAILVDASASQERVLKDEQRAALDFVRRVLRPARDSAAIVSFTGVTRVELRPAADLAQIETAINRVRVTHTPASPECFAADVPEAERARCYTAVWDSVALATREVLAPTPETARRAIILLSDGDDTYSRLRLYQAAETAVKNNVAIYSIGIRDEDFDLGELRRDHLRRVSEETGGRAFFPKRPEDLASAFAQIEQELRSQYLISYRPTNRARDGAFRRVKVEVINDQLRKQKLRLLHREGYYARGGDEAKAVNGEQ